MRAKRDVCLRRCVLGAVLAAASLLPTSSAAQAVVDAGRVEFTPSADHNRTSGGVSIVTLYRLQIFAVGSTQITRTVDLGKPSPEGDGFIRLDFVRLLSTPLTPGQQYQARVAAVGPGGTAASALSNQFSFSPTCAPTLSSSSAALPAAASTGTVTVTAAAGCAWAASSPVSWLTITSGASGSGTRPVTFAATTNPSASPRSTTLTIAGRSFGVTQSGATTSCSYSISPTTRASVAGGESISVAVTAGSGCAWSATSNAGWLTVSGGSNRSGSGNVTIVVAANTSTSARTGTATVAGRTYTVNQSGACAYTVSPRSISSSAGGRTGTIAVATASGCRWVASGMPSWITVPEGSRSGSGTVSYTVATNSATASRGVTLTVAGRRVTVSQSGATAPGRPTGLRVVTGAADGQ
ncbi:MAG: BACON domain-containing protein [Vicinamibacterales bacterium]